MTKTHSFSFDYLEYDGTGKGFFQKAMIAKTQADKDKLLDYVKGSRKTLSHLQAYELFVYMLRNPSEAGLRFILANVLHNLCSDELKIFLITCIEEKLEHWLSEKDVGNFKHQIQNENIPLSSTVYIQNLFDTVRKKLEAEDEIEPDSIPRRLVANKVVREIFEYIVVYDVMFPFRKLSKEKIKEYTKTMEKVITTDLKGESLEEKVRQEMLEDRTGKFWLTQRDEEIENCKTRIKILEKLDSTDPDFGKNLTEIKVGIY
tara:strand:- start:936 stop:1715 length:780 start_codon:yes stop_codon:yes gene_type:complete